LKRAETSLKPVRGANVVGPVIRSRRRAKHLKHKDLIARLEGDGVPMGEPALSKIENQQRAVLDYEVLAFARALGVSLAKLYPPRLKRKATRKIKG
jgi:hypothetical protein